MDDIQKLAVEIVKAQAQVRPMTAEEITSMIQRLSRDFSSLSEGTPVEGETQVAPFANAKKSIKEKSVTCLICGKSFKVLTAKHLASHDLTPEGYKEKFGLNVKAPLVCKDLQRERRKKMKSMRLWEKRRANSVATEGEQAAPAE